MSRLIILEGIEGSGKSTQAQRLHQKLSNTVLTKEPGGSDLGADIREILLDPQKHLSDLSELFLFASDRAQHIERVINPSLEAGYDVICDRFSLSTLAYQSAQSNLDAKQVEQVDAIARSALRADRISQFLLDVPVEQTFERMGRCLDRIEQRGLDYHRRVATLYRERAYRLFPTIVVDGSQNEEAVTEELLRWI